MPVTINGSTGVTANVIPDNGSVTTTKIVDGNVTPAKLSQPLTQMTAQASTSGTAIDFTGIPSWVRRVTVMFNGVSTNGTSLLLCRIGTASGVETSGYSAGAANGLSANQFSQASGGYVLSCVNNTVAASLFTGSFTLANISGNQWVISGYLNETNFAVGNFFAGAKTLAGVLDRLRITTVNGTDTFDAGSINVMYE